MKAMVSRVFVRNLTVLGLMLILFGSTSLANTQNGATPLATTPPSTGWTWVQDSPLIFCTGSSCGPNNYQGNITPTVAGSVWIVWADTPINNVTGPSGTTWVHCPNCRSTNSTSGISSDAWYAFNGPAGTTQGITITLSASGGFNFAEVLPPPGTTASYDTSNTSTPTNCSGPGGGTCAQPALNSGGALGGTDFIFINDGAGPPKQWNSVTAPFAVDPNGASYCLNCTSGAAPALTYFGCGAGHASSCNPAFFSLAFKSSAGTFTPPSQFSIVQYTAPNTATTAKPGPFTTCNPSCSLPLQQATTGSGHLLFLASGNNGPHITAVTCNTACPGWTVPSNCQQSASANGANYGLSCAYNLSIPSGVASLNITMSSSGTNNTFAAIEAASTTGGFVFDQQNNFASPTGTEFPTAPAMTGITNDFIVQLFINSGGSLGGSFYPQPYNLSAFNYFYWDTGSIGILANSGPNPPPISWINCCFTVGNSNTFGSGTAFAASGTAAAPNPPTGLTAIVH